MVQCGLVVVRGRDGLQLELDGLIPSSLECRSKTGFRVAILFLALSSDKSYRAANDRFQDGGAKLGRGLFTQVSQDTRDQILERVSPAKNFRTLKVAVTQKGFQ